METRSNLGRAVIYRHLADQVDDVRGSLQLATGMELSEPNLQQRSVQGFMVNHGVGKWICSCSVGVCASASVRAWPTVLLHFHRAVTVTTLIAGCNCEVRTKLTTKIIIGPLLDLLSAEKPLSVRNLLDGDRVSCLFWRYCNSSH